MGTSGVFFETDQVFSRGDPIRLTLLMSVWTRLHCQGQIVRIERREGKIGVAVAFTSYTFGTPGGLAH